MLYALDQGAVEQSVTKSAMRIRGKVPDKFQNEPELRAGLELYLDAFFDLDLERSHGMGWTRIPWSSIARYAHFYTFNEDLTDRLIEHIKAMDSAHIERLEKNRKDKEPQK